MDETNPLSVKAFLSHRYRSPEINIYFFNLFSEHVRLHFDVDLGSVATNVTRLERMIRGCEAFIGIYPYPGSGAVAPGYGELMDESKYFRLELDLAIRSRKPALVFYDRHYGSILRWSRNIRFVEFDSAEILGSSSPPSEGRFRNAFEQFAKTIGKSQAYSQAVEYSIPTDVGLLVPSGSGGQYRTQEITAIKNVLTEHGYHDIEVIPYPPQLDRKIHLLLEEFDWVIADVGDHDASSLVAYMHGQFIPTMRLIRVMPGASRRSHLERVLYGAIEVGYSKDIIRWEDIHSLEKGLSNRLESLRIGVRYISKPQLARNYFLEASRRKKSVFFSYASGDEEFAREFRHALEESFQQVFDYRDGQSLEPGKKWRDQIESQIAESDLGIALLTEGYIDSTNCMEELRLMLEARTRSGLLVYPIKLNRDKFNLPPHVSDLHYLRWWEYQGIEGVIERVTELFDNASTLPSENRED